jgi:hypothetical protein
MTANPDPLDDFTAHYQPPSHAQLAVNAEMIGHLTKLVEHVQMRHYSNDAHPSWHALSLAYSALRLSQVLCQAERPYPDDMQHIRLSLEYLEHALSGQK